MRQDATQELATSKADSGARRSDGSPRGCHHDGAVVCVPTSLESETFEESQACGPSQFTRGYDGVDAHALAVARHGRTRQWRFVSTAPTYILSSTSEGARVSRARAACAHCCASRSRSGCLDTIVRAQGAPFLTMTSERLSQHINSTDPKTTLAASNGTVQ